MDILVLIEQTMVERYCALVCSILSLRIYNVCREHYEMC